MNTLIMISLNLPINLQTLIGGMVELTGDSGGGQSTLKADMEYFVTKLSIFALIQGLVVLIVGCAK